MGHKVVNPCLLPIQNKVSLLEGSFLIQKKTDPLRFAHKVPTFFPFARDSTLIGRAPGGAGKARLVLCNNADTSRIMNTTFEFPKYWEASYSRFF